MVARAAAQVLPRRIPQNRVEPVHHDPGDRPTKGKNRQHPPPPSGAHSALEGVKQLLAERAKFEKWLTDLDAKRASTPPKVFDRVKADYSTRLQGVLNKLREHSSAMQQHSKSLSERLARLAESEQEMLETRAESELRAEVGELSEGEWERTSKKLERELAKIKDDQELIQADLNDLRELLAAFGDEPAAPVGATPTASQAVPNAERSSAERPSIGDDGNVDELAFLKSVIGPTPSAAPAASVPPTAPTPKPAPKPAVEKLVETPPPGPVIRSKPGEEPLAMHVTGSNPIVLRSSGVVEQPKTLKCGECGSLNYPSEWYCERCGAELTAA